MGNKVLEFFRAEEPRFSEVDDRTLTSFIAAEYPEFLQEPTFAKRHDLYSKQATARQAGEAGGAMALAGRLGTGIERGLQTPERMIRNGLDALGWYDGLDKVLGTGTQFQDYNQSWLKSMDEQDSLNRAQDNAIAPPTFAGQLVEGVGKGVAELPFQVLPASRAATTAQAVKASAAIAGTQSGLETYGDRRQQGEGRLPAAIRGAEAAMITGLTTKAFGASGVESIFRQEGVKGIGKRIGNVLKQSGMEGWQEMVDELQQDLLRRYHDNPAAPIKDTVEQLLLAGSIGATIGGMITAITPNGLPKAATPPAPNAPPVDLPSAIEAARQKARDNMAPPPIPTVNDGMLAEPITGDFIEGGEPDAAPIEPPPLPTPTAPPAPAPAPTAPVPVPPLEPMPPVGDPGSENTFPLPKEALAALDQVPVAGTSPEWAQALPEPPPPIYTVKGDEGMVAEVRPTNSGQFAVAVYDSDAREYLESIRIYPTLDAAKRKAETIQSTPPTITPAKPQDWRSRERFVGEDFAGPPRSLIIQLRDLDSVPLNRDPIVVPLQDTLEKTVAEAERLFFSAADTEQASYRESLIKLTDDNGRAFAQLAASGRKLQVARQEDLELARRKWLEMPLSPALPDAETIQSTPPTITGSNAQAMGAEMPVPPPSPEAGGVSIPEPTAEVPAPIEPPPLPTPTAPPAPAPAPAPMTVSLTPEEKAAISITKLKGVEQRSTGVYFVPEKLMTPGRRRKLKKSITGMGGETVIFRDASDFLKDPYARGYFISNRLETSPDRYQLAAPAPKPATAPEATEVTSTRPEAETAKMAPPEPPRKPRRVRREIVGDVLDAVELQGRMMSASRARATKSAEWWKRNKSLYNDAPTLPGAHNFIYGGNLTPDQVLKNLQLDSPGTYGYWETNDLWAAIAGASKARKKMTQMRAREDKFAREDARQALAFDKATKTGEIGVRAGDLAVGDVLDVEGETLRVTDVDPDTGDVLLEDGSRFGRQRVSESELLYVEQLDKAEASTDFLGEEDSAPEIPQPKPEPFKLETLDDNALQAQKDKEAAQADRRRQQGDLNERRNQRLIGSTGDLGQGDLLREPTDLLAPPSPGRGVAQTLNKATLPRQIDDGTPRPEAGPIHAQQIREYLQKALDVPFRTGTGAGRAGFFKPKAEVIRAKEGLLNSLTVATHEVGHYLHEILLSDPAVRQFDAELLALGAPGNGNSSATANSSQDYVRGEGVAEFVRLHLTDPAQALAAAPRFGQYFTDHLEQNHKPVADILDHARQMVADYVNQPAVADLKALINWNPKGRRQSLREWFDKLYDNWFNELAPVERAGKRLMALGLPEADAMRAAQLATNFLGGWVGKVEYSLYRRQMDFAGKDVGPSLREILASVPDVNEFAMWATALRVLEKSGQGKATGFNGAKLSELRKWVADNRRANLPAYKKLNRFLDNELQMAVDAGFLKPEEAKRIKRANQFFVPFHQDRESMGTKGRGRGFIDVPKPLKRFVGTDGRIFNPLESIIKNMYHLREAADRNRVAEAFVQAISQTQGGGRVADTIAKRLKPQDVDVPESVLLDWLAANDFENTQGLDPKDVLAQSPLSFRLWQLHHQQSDASQGIFQVWRDGKQQRWQTDDLELFRALQLADATEATILSKLPLRPLEWMTRLLRSGATMTAEFMARNILRDPETAAVYSKHGFIPLYDTARGLFHALRKDDLYWDFVKSGGRYADFVAQDRRDLRAKLTEVAGAETAAEMVLKWGNPLLSLQKITEKMELSTRIAEFDRARKAGKSDLEAANAAKDVTLNFSRAGFRGRFVNRLVPFFNAQLQDVDKFAREHDPRNIKNAAKVALRGTLYLTLPSIMAWWMGKDDEEIQKLPDWRKTFFWNVRVADEIMSVPKPFLLGQVYGTSVERALDYMHGKDPNALRKWMMDTLKMTVPIPAPAGAKPIVEAAANYSFFRDAPLESQADLKLPKQFRTTPATSETSKMISRMTAEFLGDERTLSPIVLDNTIRGTMGGMGKYGTDALDFLAAKSGLVDLPPAPTKKWTEIIGVRAFFGSPYAANQDFQRFYNGLERAEQVVNTLRDLQTITDGHAGTYWQRNKERQEHYQGDNLARMRAISEQLSNISKAMLITQQNRNLTGDEKAAQLLQHATNRNNLAALGLTYLHPQDRAKVQ
jgi:hypothetical protein